MSSACLAFLLGDDEDVQITDTEYPATERHRTVDVHANNPPAERFDRQITQAV